MSGLSKYLAYDLELKTLQTRKYRLSMSDMNVIIRMEEVRKHEGDKESVWFVIHDKVYDVSAFLEDVSGKMECTQSNRTDTPSMVYNRHLKFQTGVSLRIPLYGSRNLTYISRKLDYVCPL